MSWAVILGASSGSGAAIARTIGQERDVYGAHRGNWPEDAQQITNSVREAGRRCEWFVGDASTPESAKQGAQDLLELAGPRSVDLFVHAIASASVGPLLTGSAPMHPRQITRTFERMAHSFVYWAGALLEHDLLAPGALLLGLSNPMHRSLIRDTALIAATKAALQQYVRHLAYELGPLGHRVNLLEFGRVETPAVRRTFSPKSLGNLENAVKQGVPAGRLATMDELAGVVRWLATAEATFFNGATIDFTGGEGRTWFDVAVHGH